MAGTTGATLVEILLDGKGQVDYIDFNLVQAWDEETTIDQLVARAETLVQGRDGSVLVTRNGETMAEFGQWQPGTLLLPALGVHVSAGRLPEQQVPMDEELLKIAPEHRFSPLRGYIDGPPMTVEILRFLLRSDQDPIAAAALARLFDEHETQPVATFTARAVHDLLADHYTEMRFPSQADSQRYDHWRHSAWFQQSHDGVFAGAFMGKDFAGNEVGIVLVLPEHYPGESWFRYLVQTAEIME